MGGVEIEREVFGENSVLENVVEKAFVAGPEPDGVVSEVGVSSVRAKIN